MLGDRLEQAVLFKDLATLRTEPPLFRDVDELRWRGGADGFAEWAERVGDARLVERCAKALAGSAPV